ncbi:hypothetical protein V8E51_008711 [Hyaloscypha variabilis]
MKCLPGIHFSKGILETRHAHVQNFSTTLYSNVLDRTSGMLLLACSSILAGQLVLRKEPGKEGFSILLYGDDEEEELPI